MNNLTDNFDRQMLYLRLSITELCNFRCGYCLPSGCPYKKIYYNWKKGKSEKCIFCYPRIESGQPPVCAETCVGRIRYVGVLLYDADKIKQTASVENEKSLYQAQLDMFLDPHDPKVIAQAKKDGVPENWLIAAKKSPVYKMAIDWKIAFPLHPEFRTLPMVWYVPPLSPIQTAAESGKMGVNGIIPDVKSMRIPVKYLANLLTAGEEHRVVSALEKMLAMRAYMRSEKIGDPPNEEALRSVGLTTDEVKEMYRYMAIANYEDRFVVPTAHTELYAKDPFNKRASCGFSCTDCEFASQGKNNFGGIDDCTDTE